MEFSSSHNPVIKWEFEIKILWVSERQQECTHYASETKGGPEQASLIASGTCVYKGKRAEGLMGHEREETRRQR